MTFKRFEELFLTKYPNGEVIGHGKFAQTERNKKTTVIFNPNGKCYHYYGAYEDILNRLGIKVYSESRLHSLEMSLKHYKEWHGQPSLFGDGVDDYSAEIKRLESDIADIKENYVIV